MSKITSDTNEIMIDETLNREEEQGRMRAYEDDILGGLLAAAGFRDNEDEIQTIEIARDGKVYITFRIRPLSEEEYQKCRDKYTKYVKNKQYGIKMPENTDTAMYRSALIFEATVDEDKEKLWNNKDAWKALDVLSGPQLVGKVLKAGEKAAVLNKVDEISGYGMTMDEVAKN